MATSNPETLSPPGPSAAASPRALEIDRACERKTRPVFIVGCHRSGTNLLYDMLLSAGGFAVYRGYLPVYKMLIPRFGNLATLDNRQKLMNTWIRSKGFRRSGVDAEELTVTVLDECRSGGDFIRMVMSRIARSQNVSRWMVYDPDNLLHIPRIKAETPEALFVHIIRDGRDVSLSLSKMGGFKPVPWYGGPKGLLPTAAYWEWMVRKGRHYGLPIPSDYMEVRYEELVSDPRAALRKLELFLDHDLDYDCIQNAGLGRLREPNSSFPEEKGRGSPVNRWRAKLSSDELVSIEAMIGEYLEELGYPLSSPQAVRKAGLREKYTRTFYFELLNAKLWLKTQTPAGRLTNLEALELSDSIELAEAE